MLRPHPSLSPRHNPWIRNLHSVIECFSWRRGSTWRSMVAETWSSWTPTGTIAALLPAPGPAGRWSPSAWWGSSRRAWPPAECSTGGRCSCPSSRLTFRYALGRLLLCMHAWMHFHPALYSDALLEMFALHSFDPFDEDLLIQRQRKKQGREERRRRPSGQAYINAQISEQDREWELMDGHHTLILFSVAVDKA